MMENRVSAVQEPTIMTADFLEEKIVHDIVQRQGLNVSEVLKLVKKDGLPLDVFSFNLEYQNLVNIDDLWRYKLLTKLEMPNNLLEEIEGLDSLVNLQNLDLSFNFIRRIKNISNLTNLVHFNLSSNEIVTLENMDSLKKLQTFLIRRNKIKSFENVPYLMQFRTLSSLAIGENPLMQEADARFCIVAVLPQLKYLDFDVVTPKQLKEAFQIFPYEVRNGIPGGKCTDEKFKCPFPHSDKKAHVEGLANGQGFQSLLRGDKNYELLHSFPLASEISQYHSSKVNQIFDEWHKRGHEHYEKTEREKSQFLCEVSKAKEYSKELYREEEMNFISFKEKIPKELCLIYQSASSGEEKDKKVTELKEKCETRLQTTFRNFMNFSCLCVDLISNLCNIFERCINSLNAKYIKDLTNFSEKIMNINREVANTLKEFYLSIQDSGLDVFQGTQLEDAKEFAKDHPTFLQLTQNKELIKMTLELSLRIQSSMLKERINGLKLTLPKDLAKTLQEILDDDFSGHSEMTRNTVVFCNKQKMFLHELFSKINSFKHYLGCQ